MESKKDTKINIDNLTGEERMKYEIAGELGLLDQVLENGWKSLSAKDTGRIGGILGRRKKNLKTVKSEEQ
jgi:hypothetical protein